MSQKLIFTNDVTGALGRLHAEMGKPQVVLIADGNTGQIIYRPELLPFITALGDDLKRITVDPGDERKNLDSLTWIWQHMIDYGATRKSLVVNLGGGMVTDLGGFAASTFKRGVRFVNVPTSLLGAVDASVGGKTGINFGGLKNEVGVFSEAEAVVISSCFFNTLPHREILSGYAEMLKHSLLDSADEFGRLLAFDLSNPCADADALLGMVERSVEVKRRIVEQDPHEAGLRRALNLGHTVGHAIESLAMKRGRPVPHGFAVAWGLVVELVLSCMKEGFPSDLLYQASSFVKENYGVCDITCEDYDELIALMRHDKKNPSADRISFTLLRAPGDILTGCYCTPEEITAAMDIFLGYN